MKYALSLILSALALMYGPIAGAQTKPDLNGTWKMNSAKSHFADKGPTGITIKFVQKDSSLLETLTLTGENGERSLDLKYTTDGKEGVNHIGQDDAKTTAGWEGGALVIEWKADGRSFRRKITLSGDGKTMTIMVHHAEPGGETADDTVVLEKQ
jgi:hypothetical protein